MQKLCELFLYQKSNTGFRVSYSQRSEQGSSKYNITYRAESYNKYFTDSCQTITFSSEEGKSKYFQMNDKGDY